MSEENQDEYLNCAHINLQFCDECGGHFDLDSEGILDIDDRNNRWVFCTEECQRRANQ